jgi:hypothetical protein
VGYSLLLNPEKVIAVEPDRVTIQGGETFGCIDCEVRSCYNKQFQKASCCDTVHVSVLLCHTPRDCVLYKACPPALQCLTVLCSPSECFKNQGIVSRFVM